MDVLTAVGRPESKLPAPILVAGTNGKGSTCAFLRAIIEAAGRRAHVYTSPHLVRLHERIRIAGSLIEEKELISILTEIEKKDSSGALSVFEAITTAAFCAFANHSAEVTILEVGLGGRLDATNVVEKRLACAIARLSFDHREYLGPTMASIAREKAGIMRDNVPCFVSRQPSNEASATLEDEAVRSGAPLFQGGRDWFMEREDNDHFRFIGRSRVIKHLPYPALLGAHQVDNAGLAIASALALPFDIEDHAFVDAMFNVSWPGRLQRVTDGALVKYLADDGELWLDGGHNDSAGEVLAQQLAFWNDQDGRPIDLVFGMLLSKKPEEFLLPLLPHVRSLRVVPVRSDQPAFAPEDLAGCCRKLGFREVMPFPSLIGALSSLRSSPPSNPRTMICGSLYLVGEALRRNAA